jgi:hypothetical protein
MNILYKNKYLKYKNKYLYLKNSMKGGDDGNIVYNTLTPTDLKSNNFIIEPKYKRW